MIINLILDILISNFTIFNSYFFLVNIFKIPIYNILQIILIAIFIDLFITNTFLINLIVILIIYFMSKYIFKNINSCWQNILVNTFNYVIYVVTFYLILNYKQPDFIYLLKYLSFSYPLYFIYVLLSYKFLNKA